MAMTYSRAAWVGLACSMAVFVFLWKPKLIPAFIALCVLAVPFLPATVLNRILTITNTADSSTSSRVSLYRAAIEVIKRSPLTGAGLGTAATQEYIREFNLYHDKAPFVHAHNFYLEVWIQTGLLGVCSFVGSMLWNTKSRSRCAAQRSLCGSDGGGGRRLRHVRLPWSAALRTSSGTTPGCCAFSGSPSPGAWQRQGRWTGSGITPRLRDNPG